MRPTFSRQCSGIASCGDQDRKLIFSQPLTRAAL
jgi:hypothetical protein